MVTITNLFQTELGAIVECDHMDFAFSVVHLNLIFGANISQLLELKFLLLHFVVIQWRTRVVGKCDTGRNDIDKSGALKFQGGSEQWNQLLGVPRKKT